MHSHFKLLKCYESDWEVAWQQVQVWVSPEVPARPCEQYPANYYSLVFKFLVFKMKSIFSDWLALKRDNFLRVLLSETLQANNSICRQLKPNDTHFTPWFYVSCRNNAKSAIITAIFTRSKNGRSDKWARIALNADLRRAIHGRKSAGKRAKQTHFRMWSWKGLSAVVEALLVPAH